MALLRTLNGPGLALIVVSGTAASWTVQAQAVDEYQVKAAYMYNFAKFVDWPAGALGSPTQPIAFCVLGQTPLSQALRDTLSGKVVDQRPLVFRQLSDSKLASKCQALFIGAADKKQMRQALDEVKSLSVLTVGEVENFTDDGGIVRFLLEAGRVRLEFNLEAAGEARLRISSRLLSLGRAVSKTWK